MKILIINGYDIFRESLSVISKLIFAIEATEVKDIHDFLKLNTVDYDVAVFISGQPYEYKLQLLKAVSEVLPTIVISYLPDKGEFQLNQNIKYFELKKITLDSLFENISLIADGKRRQNGFIKIGDKVPEQ